MKLNYFLEKLQRQYENETGLPLLKDFQIHFQYNHFHGINGPFIVLKTQNSSEILTISTIC